MVKATKDMEPTSEIHGEWEAASEASASQIKAASREAAIKAAEGAADSLERSITDLSADACVQEMLAKMSSNPFFRLRLETVNPDDQRVQVVARTADGKLKSFTVYGSTPEEVIQTLKGMIS